MKVVVNKNVKLRVGGRKAPKMSVSDFVTLLKTSVSYEDYDDEYNGHNFIYCATDGEDSSKFDKMIKDLSKVDFDMENCDNAGEYQENSDITFLDSEFPVLMTKTGVPYLCMTAGGDWEVPLIFMVYWDDKYFRGYIPTKGNSFNSLTKEAFGTSEEADDRRFFAKENMKMPFNTSIEADIDMCIEDFEARLTVSGEATLPVSKPENNKAIDINAFANAVLQDDVENYLDISDEAYEFMSEILDPPTRWYKVNDGYCGFSTIMEIEIPKNRFFKECKTSKHTIMVCSSFWTINKQKYTNTYDEDGNNNLNITIGNVYVDDKLCNSSKLNYEQIKGFVWDRLADGWAPN